MNLNYNTFATNLDQATGMDVSDEHTNYGWHQWDSGSTDDFNKVLEYTYDNSDGTFNYRTWHQEVSLMKENGGMLISAKIDYERGTGDDHLIILLGFKKTSSKPSLIFAQASVQFHGSEDNNIITAPVTTGYIAQGIYDAINAKLLSSYGHVDDSTEGRHTLPYIAKVNIDSIAEAVA